VSWLYPVLALVALQRVGELVYARRNERALRAAGAVEHGARHYPLFFVVHGGWLLSLAVFVPADQPVVWGWLIVFLLLQAGRIWVIASLGRFWTTRVLTLPDAPLVRRGPYQYLRHPNYLIVAGEIAALPLAFSAYTIAIVFSIANAALLWHRIRVEATALAPRRRQPGGAA